MKVHHLVCDGVGLIGFLQAAQKRYDDPDFDPNWDYRRVVAAQQQYYDGPDFESDREYWTHLMADRPEPARLLPTVYPPGLGHVHARFDLPVEQLTPLRALASEHGVRPTVLLIAAVAAFTHHRTGRSDLPIALPVTGRLDRATRTTPSMVTSVLPLRLQVDARDTVGDIARRANQALFGLIAHSRFRGEDLGRALAEQGSRHAMFGLGVNVMSNTTRQMVGGLPTVTHALASGPVSDVEIQIQLRRRDAPAEVIVRAVRDAGPDAVEVAKALRTFLAALAATPHARVAAVGSPDLPVAEDTSGDHGPLALTPALHRLRSGGIDPDTVLPRVIRATAGPEVATVEIRGVLDALTERHGALRTTLDRSIPILWTLHTDAPGEARRVPAWRHDTATGEVILEVDPVLCDPPSAQLLTADLQLALDDLAAGRVVRIDPAPVSLHRITGKLTAAATDVSALPDWLQVLAPGAQLPCPRSHTDTTEPEPASDIVEVRRALTSTTSSPPTATHLVPAVAIAVAEVFDDLEEVLVDVVADLRPAGAERTVGPLQALRPVRVRLPHGDNPITDNTITDPVDGPELDVLAHLAPQVASALAGAAASGTIVAPQLLIGDLGLPTDHPARVAIVDDNGHRASSCPSIAREWRGPTISRRPSPTASSQRPRGG